jgi:hypothetical protein
MGMFKEWLQKEDPSFCYCEGMMDWVKGKLAPAAMLGALALGGNTALSQQPVPPPTTQAATQPAVINVPSQAEQQRALQELKKIFKDDIANANTKEGKIALAKTFLQTAIGTKDMVLKYVLLTQAQTLASQNGDGATAMAAVNVLVKEFSVKDPLATRANVALKAKGVTYEQVSQLIDEALNQDNYPLAKRLASVGVRIASDEQKPEAVAKSRAITQTSLAFGRVKSSLVKLEASPDDTRANRAVGEYYAFYKQDWQKGLPYLVKSGDKTLVTLAQLDMTNPKEAAEQAALGDEWWDYAERQKGIVQNNIKERAKAWYEKALPSLTGVEKIRVEKRVLGEAYEMVGTWVVTQGGWKSTWIFLSDHTVHDGGANGVLQPNDKGGRWWVQNGQICIQWERIGWWAVKLPLNTNGTQAVASWEKTTTVDLKKK